jgi:hypothetical protein
MPYGGTFANLLKWPDVVLVVDLMACPLKDVHNGYGPTAVVIPLLYIPHE